MTSWLTLPSSPPLHPSSVTYTPSRSKCAKYLGRQDGYSSFLFSASRLLSRKRFRIISIKATRACFRFHAIIINVSRRKGASWPWITRNYFQRTCLQFDVYTSASTKRVRRRRIHAGWSLSRIIFFLRTVRLYTRGVSYFIVEIAVIELNSTA